MRDGDSGFVSYHAPSFGYGSYPGRKHTISMQPFSRGVRQKKRFFDLKQLRCRTTEIRGVRAATLRRRCHPPRLSW